VTVSADGDTAVVAGPNAGSGVGGVWVFTRSGSTWSEQAKLTGGEETGNGHFGRSVAVSGDGNTVIVGGRLDNNAVGAAWVFTRSGSVWTQDGPKLTAEGEEGYAQFGDSVAMSTEGDTAVVGGPNDDKNAGAAWVFTRSGTTWKQEGAKLTSNVSNERRFGSSVALSANGNVALVGEFAARRRVGGAWEFKRSGTVWHREGIFLTPEETGTPEQEEELGEGEFGRSVALSGNGETSLVGGPGAAEEMGAALLFEGPPLVHEVEEEEESGHGTGKHGGKEEQHNTENPSQQPSPLQQPASSPQIIQGVKIEVLAGNPAPPPAATASCRLVGSHLSVSRTGRVSAELVCSGNHSASGKLMLTVTKHVKRKVVVKRAGANTKTAVVKTKTITQTITIASAAFAIAPNKTATATLSLTKTGHALLTAGHGRLSVAARLAKLLPTPAQTRTAAVQLVLQKPAAKKTHKK
jgi:hypothetical protein